MAPRNRWLFLKPRGHTQRTSKRWEDLTSRYFPTHIIARRLFYAIRCLLKNQPGRHHPEGARVGAACSFTACLSYLSIDNASLSRRSTVPTPNRYTSSSWALIALFSYIKSFLFCKSQSLHCFAACGHHLSPRVAIVLSLPSTAVVDQIPPCHIRPFPSSPLLAHPVPPYTLHIFDYVTIHCFATRTHLLCIYFLLLASINSHTSFFLAGPGHLHEIAVSAFSSSPLISASVQVRFHSYPNA